MIAGAGAINFGKIQGGLSRVVGQSLPSTCDISRDTTTSDGAGGFTDTPFNVATGVACRVEPVSILRSGAEIEMAAKLTSIEPRVVVLPGGQDVTVKDRIVFGTQTFEVKSILAPMSFELYRRVLADLVV